MDTKLKEEWVQALRSGDYRQGRSLLRKQGKKGIDSYCCLGVLCDVVDPGGWGVEGQKGSSSLIHSLAKSYIEIVDREQIGLSDESQTLLMQMNDNGWSFEEIADYIEKNL